MSYQNVALIGKSRSGKDTVGAHLVSAHRFTRLAFADPLKRMALDVNPYIPTSYGVTVRLQTLIADVGWDYAKDTYPEVRCFLQRLGQSAREHDEDVWLRPVIQAASTARVWNMPVVVTDCRYRNEATALSAAGFLMVRIERPGLVSADTHDSENELNDYQARVTVPNTGTVAALEALASTLVRTTR